MTYGIKVSKPGIDVDSATVDQTNLDSNYPNYKIHSKGNLTLDVSPYQDPDAADFIYVTLTIPHNLGYSPAFWAWGINNDTDNYFLNMPFPAHGEVGAAASSDETNLYIEIYVAPWTLTTNTWSGYYYIFKDGF